VAQPVAQQEAEPALLTYLRHGATDALGRSNRTIADALGIERTTLARAASGLAQIRCIDIETHRKGTRFSLKQRAS
jgi:hypothetical protein